jgi:hypothetical protein
MTIDNAETTVAETRRVLIAELTWARLYTNAMHKILRTISTVIRKNRRTTNQLEMKKSAEKLHDQLQSANRTVAELSDHAGISGRPHLTAVEDTID